MGAYVKSSVWYYAPNKVAPIVFAVLFFISACIHVFQNTKYHWWKLVFALPWAATIFVAAMAMRAVGAFDYDNLDVSIASSVLVVAAPPVFAAANYIILSRTLYYIPYHTPIHPGRILSTFIGLDVLIEALTINGATMLFNRDRPASTIKAGGNLIKAGTILQISTIVLFIGTALTFYVRCAKAQVLHARTRQVLYTLFASSALVVTRSLYGVVVTFEALSATHVGPAITNEWVFWVFDAVVMLANSYLMNVMHPGRLLPRNHKIYLARDGQTEIEGPGWQDKRPFIVTVVDPFDLVGLLTGRDRKTAFWEQQDTNMSGAGNRGRSAC
ncbi:MAG: hypothetical protein M1816_001266 [Peltula sp. TS41687]|nr:MAG: hypothetical protein M1816_001266 [Peltula sp. TS41687]